MQALPNKLSAARTLDSFVLQDERAVCELDSRMSFSATGSGEVQLPLTAVENTSGLTSSKRALLGVDADSESAILIGGGAAQHWSTAWTETDSFHERARGLFPLIQSVLRRSIGRFDTVVAPWVSSTELATFMNTPKLHCAVSPNWPHFSLHTTNTSNRLEFSNTVSRSARANWLKDFQMADADYTLAEQPFNERTMLKGGQFLAQTSIRNGDEDHELLAAMRLGQYASRPGTHSCFTILQGETVVAFLMWTTYGRYLFAHTFACPDLTPRRTEVYRAALVFALDFALAHSVSHIHLGPSHAAPKQARGFQRVPTWTIRYFEE